MEEEGKAREGDWARELYWQDAEPSGASSPTHYSVTASMCHSIAHRASSQVQSHASRPWGTSMYDSSSSAPSSPSGTSVYLPSGRSTRRCKCKIYLIIFNLTNYNQRLTTMGCMVDHIHLDKNTFNKLFQKETVCSSLLIILFDSDCVHIYGII
jgi:hypothetical protein